MATPRILVYLLRRDLRFADNPILHEIFKSCQQSHQAYTHLLPLYVFAAPQLEVSGFLSSETEKSPFPEARSATSGFWRCGPHRAKFLAESVWDLRKSLENVGSGLEIRVGLVGQVVKELLESYKQDSLQGGVVSVWMTSEEGVEEQREEREVKKAVKAGGQEFRLWTDEKYYVDEYAASFPNSSPRRRTDQFPAATSRFESLLNYQTSSHRIASRSSLFERRLGDPCQHLPNYHHSLTRYLHNQRPSRARLRSKRLWPVYSNLWRKISVCPIRPSSPQAHSRPIPSTVVNRPETIGSNI